MKHEKQEIKDIGIQLGPWCEGGIYGRRFTTSLPPINFNSRFIVLELEELKPTPHLQWVVLMSIIRAAQHAMFIKKDGRRRLFILDEAREYIGESNGDDAAVNFLLNSLKQHGVVSVKQTVQGSVLHRASKTSTSRQSV